MTTLGFLHADAAGGAMPRSPLADAAGRSEVRDGWELALSFGDPGGVEVVDASALGKLELHGEHGEPVGAAVRHDDAWWCPVTPDRALLLCDPDAMARVRGEHDGALDLTSSFGALRLRGSLARETFARFCALDLRDRSAPVGAFRPGSVARTPGFVLRADEESWLMVFGAAYGAYVWEVVCDAAAHVTAHAPVPEEVVVGA